MDSLRHPILAAVLQNAQEAILILDDSGTILHANLMAEQVFGRSLSEIKGESVDSLFEAESIAALRSTMEQSDDLEGVLPLDKSSIGAAVGRRGQSIQLRYTIGQFRLEGAVRYVLCALDAREHQRASDKVRMFTEILEDQANQRAEDAARAAIHQRALEQARAELGSRDQTIREQFAELQYMYDVAPAALAYLDAQLRFTRVNTRMGALAGVDPEALINRHAGDVDSPAIAAVLPFCVQAAEQRQPVLGVEIPLAAPASGETRTWLVNCSPILAGEMLRGVLVSWTDITAWKEAREAHRRSEERFRRLAEATFEGVVIHRSGTILECNDAFVQLVGASSRAEVIGRALSGAVSLADGMREFEALIGAGGESQIEAAIERPNGPPLPVELRSREVEYADGPAAVIGIRDIEERKRLEAHQRHVQRMEALGTLAGGIAHDFNNVLAAVLGYTELALRATPDGSSIQSDLRESLAAINRARSLVRQILAFGRGSREFAEPTDLVWAVNDCLASFMRSMPANIRLVQDTERACAPVVAEAEQIRVAVLNLCENACQAMREMGGDLHVSVREVGVSRDANFHSGSVEPGRYVRLRVRDTGLGMSPETMERMYEPFFTTQRPGESSGLGLSTVYGIVRMLGGAIAVESTPGEGTQFDVYFPIAAAVLQQRGRTGREGRRVLVVDDEQTLAEAIVAALAREGHRAEAFSNPRRALETFKAAPGTIDLIISDLTMPQMSGLELAREVRLRRADVPIIVMTGYEYLLNDEEARQLNIARVLQKPFAMPYLIEAVQAVWNAGSAARGRAPRD